MNLRFEGDAVRFRVTEKELGQLIDTGRLVAATPLPGGQFRYALELVDDEHWQFTGDAHAIVLRLSRRDVIGHRASLPSKQGLARTLSIGNGNGLVEASFEVDAKRRRP